MLRLWCCCSPPPSSIMRPILLFLLVIACVCSVHTDAQDSSSAAGASSAAAAASAMDSSAASVSSSAAAAQSSSAASVSSAADPSAAAAAVSSSIAASSGAASSSAGAVSSSASAALSSTAVAAGPPAWNASNPRGDQAVGVQNIPYTLVCSNAPWSARYAHAAVASGDTVIVIGGIGWWDATNASQALTDVWSSPDMGASWTRITDAAPFGIRQGATAVLVNGGVALIAGETLQGEARSDVWFSSDLGKQFKRVCTGCFPSRSFPTSSVDVTTNKIVMTGGLSLLGSRGGGQRAYNDVYWSSDSGTSWDLSTTAAPWSARYGATSFWKLNVVYVLGGVEMEGGVSAPASDLWHSEDHGRTWEEVLRALPSGVGPRSFMASASFANGLYILAGCAGAGRCVLETPDADAVYGDMWASVDSGRSWRWQESTAAFGVRSGAAFVQSKGSMLVLGGVNRGRVMNDIYRAELPTITDRGTDGVVGGVLGIATFIVILTLAARHALNTFQESRERKRRAMAAVREEMIAESEALVAAREHSTQEPMVIEPPRSKPQERMRLRDAGARLS